MKKYLILAILCFSLVNSAYATPDASDWYKVDLIGSNGTNFYYYLTHEKLPGSYYYSFTEYYLVSRNIKTGKTVDEIHLKTTKNTSEMEKVEDGEAIFAHKYEHPFMSDVNPMKILRDNDVDALYPYPDAERRFKFDEKGMYFIKKGKRIEIVSKEYLDRFMPGYQEWLEWERGIGIVQVYVGRGYHYFLVQYGEGGDIDYFQAVLPVSTKLIYQLND